MLTITVLDSYYIQGMEHAGYKVGIIAQPNWKTTEDFMKLGRPRLDSG